jgi:hypothetical protein
MVDKKSTKRTQVKDLPKKNKNLSKGDMKKVKGGIITYDEHGGIKFDGVDGEIKSKTKPIK